MFYTVNKAADHQMISTQCSGLKLFSVQVLVHAPLPVTEQMKLEVTRINAVDRVKDY